MEFFKSFEEINEYLLFIKKETIDADKDFSKVDKQIFLSLKDPVVLLFDIIKVDQLGLLCCKDYFYFKNQMSSSEKTKYYQHNPYISFSIISGFIITYFELHLKSSNSNIDNLKNKTSLQDHFNLIYLIIIKNLYLVLERIKDEEVSMWRTIQSYMDKIIASEDKYSNTYTIELFNFIKEKNKS